MASRATEMYQLWTTAGYGPSGQLIMWVVRRNVGVADLHWATAATVLGMYLCMWSSLPVQTLAHNTAPPALVPLRAHIHTRPGNGFILLASLSPALPCSFLCCVPSIQLVDRSMAAR